MNRKGTGSSQIAIAIAATIVLSGSMAPRVVAAKASSDAIIGTGVDAIIGTGKGAKRSNAIIGTGADAIIGTGLDAIIGTGSAKASSDAIIGTGKPLLLLLGPVDSVDVRKSTISVLGRTFRAPVAARIDMTIKAGQQVSVALFGVLTKGGAIEKATLRFAGTDYVAGASKVVVSGRISEINASTGFVSVGKAVLDISSVTIAGPLQVGSLIRVVGTQPVRGGVVLVERLAQ